MSYFGRRKSRWPWQAVKADGWERDSANGGVPTFKEMDWDGESLQSKDTPGGRFEGKEYDWDGHRPNEETDEA